MPTPVAPTPQLPPLSIAKALPKGLDVLVVGLGADGLRGIPQALQSSFSKTFGVSVAEMAANIGASSATGKSRTLPAAPGGPRIIVVGLGTGTPTPEDLRHAAGSGVAQAASLGGPDAALSIAVSFDTQTAAELQATAEGALLGSYRYQPVSAASATGRPASSPSVTGLTVLHTGAVAKAGRGRDTGTVAAVVAQAVATARQWVNIPANLLYPETFAEQVRSLVRDVPVGIDVLDEQALLAGGYGGLLAVGGGSVRPPRLVRLSYRPRGATFHLVLVGKGITFDTGGLNLKPAEGMYTMKCDMAGAAAVFAATDAIARLGLKVSITAYGSLAENMPSGSAYRPSDVLTIYGGKTVENGNSDAEGRIVMADALARAQEDHPDLVVDIATLTGACVVALGDRISGVMATDQTTTDKILDAAEAAGEAFWPLPVTGEIRGKLDSKVADLKSTGPDRYAGASVAAAFLREFVADGTPWAHLDIAGPAFNDGKPFGYVSSGGTGVGVRTLIALAQSLAA